MRKMNETKNSKNIINVLEVNINDIGKGGAWSFIKNAMQSKSDVDVGFNFFTLEPFEEDENVRFVEDRGGKVYVRYTANRYMRQIKTFFDLKKVLKNEKFDIVHIHSDVAFKIFIEALACRIAGQKIIVLHSHCTGVDGDHRAIKSLAHHICKLFLGLLGTDFFACSQKAGDWMYTKKINQKKLHVINNAIDCEAFAYNEPIRQQYRQLFGILDDEILIGHVGRFMYQKNHEFLIDIFETLHQMNKKAKLILMGEGDTESKIREKVRTLGLSDSVIFAGVRNDVNCCMQAMDLFLLPSLFEGLPVVGIEAQAAGLPCLMSDTITKETNLFGLVEFASLRNSPEMWADKIMSILVNFSRKDTTDEMTLNGYNTKEQESSLVNIYSILQSRNDME